MGGNGAVTLRRWTMEDAPALAELLDNPKIRENLRDGLPQPYTAADARFYIGGVLDTRDGGGYAWAILVDGEVAGSLSITRGDNIHSRTAELGYCLGEPYWGCGVTSEAVDAACRFVFEASDILRIFAVPFDDNAASCRVLEKVGFALEGILRKNAVKSERVRDIRMYALVREEDENKR